MNTSGDTRRTYPTPTHIPSRNMYERDRDIPFILLFSFFLHGLLLNESLLKLNATALCHVQLCSIRIDGKLTEKINNFILTNLQIHVWYNYNLNCNRIEMP